MWDLATAFTKFMYTTSKDSSLSIVAVAFSGNSSRLVAQDFPLQSHAGWDHQVIYAAKWPVMVSFSRDSTTLQLT